MKRRINLLMMVLMMLAPVSSALAYIGPGAGISVLGSLLGILATFFVAIGAILIWPLRKWSKRRKARRPSAGNAGASDSPEDGRS
jgi:membrane protein implicated in regulation of membrane protease activity